MNDLYQKLISQIIESNFDNLNLNHKVENGIFYLEKYNFSLDLKKYDLEDYYQVYEIIEQIFSILYPTLEIIDEDELLEFDHYSNSSQTGEDLVSGGYLTTSEYIEKINTKVVNYNGLSLDEFWDSTYNLFELECQRLFPDIVISHYKGKYFFIRNTVKKFSAEIPFYVDDFQDFSFTEEIIFYTENNQIIENQIKEFKEFLHKNYLLLETASFVRNFIDVKESDLQEYIGSEYHKSINRLRTIFDLYPDIMESLLIYMHALIDDQFQINNQLTVTEMEELVLESLREWLIYNVQYQEELLFKQERSYEKGKFVLSVSKKFEMNTYDVDVFYISRNVIYNEKLIDIIPAYLSSIHINLIESNKKMPIEIKSEFFDSPIIFKDNMVYFYDKEKNKKIIFDKITVSIAKKLVSLAQEKRT